jgi:hypothetical protein
MEVETEGAVSCSNKACNRVISFEGGLGIYG